MTDMRKRLEYLMVMGVLSISMLNIGVTGYAQETESETVKTVAETEKQTEAPATEAPTTEAPTSEAPATEAPATEAPATEAPTTEAPTTEEPVTEAPDTETTEAETSGTESETSASTEAETTAPTESETSTEWNVGTALDETVEIIDNSIDEEKIAKIEAEAKKKTDKKKEEEAKKQYELKIGESIIDFNAYPAGNITENTNKIYDYLVKEMGLNHAAACGILANIQCESNFAPTAVGDGGTSYGLCQWHLERFARLVNWCNANGYNYHLVEGQMAYLQYELETMYVDVYEYVKQVPDTIQGCYDAAYYWCAYYEIPSETFAKAKQRGNMAMNEFFPRELGVGEEVEAEEAETEEAVEVEEETGIEKESRNLWDKTEEIVYQMYRLDIPQSELLILE